VALQRVRMTEQLLRSEKLRQEIAVAHDIQQGTLPKTLPEIPGYDFIASFLPADDTGGDIYDFVTTAQGELMLLMGDATGHGIGAALSAIQVRAMLRLAQRMGAGLDDTFRHINDQLVVDLPEDRFVTAFLGCLDPSRHVLRYHSGGQGPLLHFRASGLACDIHAPTTFPFGAMPIAAMRLPKEVELAPGDIFALISDGVYEYHDAQGQLFGEQAVIDLLRDHHDRPLPKILDRLQEALLAFAQGAPQLDDITVVLIRRRIDPSAAQLAPGVDVNEAKPAQRSFPRSFDALEAMFAFIQQELAVCGADDSVRYAIEFTAEELFTNMVKYNPSGGGMIDLSIACDDSELVCRLTDHDSDRFDVTAAPDVDIHMPTEQRRPGGLGLHLIRRLVDSVEYDYSGRRSLITFRKTLGGG
ncbi:MAG: SpoIIE family protein phosphatase, partial [Lysobacteraceae bacterium]